MKRTLSDDEVAHLQAEAKRQRLDGDALVQVAHFILEGTESPWQMALDDWNIEDWMLELFKRVGYRGAFAP